MKKFPSGSVELYNMIDEAKVFLSDTFKRNKQYVNVESMSYEEIICRLYIECDNLQAQKEGMARQMEYAREDVKKAENAVKTIEEAFLIAKVKMMEHYFNEVGKKEKKGAQPWEVGKYSQDYIAGYATAIGDLNKFLTEKKD